MYTGTKNIEFLTETNAQMIWDIIQESSVYNDVEYNDKIEIRKNFVQNMRAFYELKGKGIPHLIEQNKLFISAVLNEYRSKDKPFKKEAYTVKEIQAERASQFEKDLDKRRNEFENAVATPKPPAPVFADKMDKPISEMSALIARAMTEREQEIAQIHQGLSRAPSLQTPMETSVRSEKQVFKQIYISDEEVPRNIIQETVLPLHSALDKKVTVDESQNRIHLFVEDIGAEEDNGIMSKFKINNTPELEDNGGRESDYQELRQVQRRHQRQYQQILLKIDELTNKMDLIVQLFQERSS
jgi:hypothetical protein